MTTTRIVRALLHKDPSYPANGSRECAPDDRLREDSTARHGRMDCFVAEFIIGPAEGGTRWLFAMTGFVMAGHSSLPLRRLRKLACAPGHPRLSCCYFIRAWMAGTTRASRVKTDLENR